MIFFTPMNGNWILIYIVRFDIEADMFDFLKYWFEYNVIIYALTLRENLWLLNTYIIHRKVHMFLKSRLAKTMDKGIKPTLETTNEGLY